jgi:hypothetical protein
MLLRMRLLVRPAHLILRGRALRAAVSKDAGHAFSLKMLYRK